ncbi:MAG: S8 family serine peptidase [candidate division Zixibacteria bacterium]|nr:S8 family serine peptidase [candidate division Zixibacteria bacterium]
MRIVNLLCVLCLAALVSAPLANYVPGAYSSAGRIIDIPGQFVVQFSDDIHLEAFARGLAAGQVGVPSVDGILSQYGVAEVRLLCPYEAGTKSPLAHIGLITRPVDQDDDAFLKAMAGDPHVVAIVHDVACRVAATPNDPGHNSQWAYKAGSQLLVHEAWDIETGSDSVIIAIIDTGENYRHMDLKNNIWVNPDEDIDADHVVFDSTDFNGTDDDGNGYVDDVIGYDFISSAGGLTPWSGEDGNTKDNDPNDFNGHGTACSGVATAVTNNSTGVAGMSGGWGPYWRGRGAQIMCLRAGLSVEDPSDPTQEGGYAIMSAVLEAINYAVNNGAHVISYSAGSSNIPGMAQALTSVMNAGIVFCAAAGNDNSSDADYFGTYPGILAVAATDQTDHKSSYSNYGSWIEVSAPGDQIYSTNSYHYSPGYTNWWGTSFSAPMTAGLAALIKSHYPNYTKVQIDTIIMDNADDISALNPTYPGQLGSGRINAFNCLANAPVAKFTATPLYGPPPLNVTFTDQSPAATSWLWDFGDGESSPDQNPVHEYDAPGIYNVALTVTDPNGTTTEVMKYYILTTADTLYGPPVNLPPGVTTAVPVYLKNSVSLNEFDLVFKFPTSVEPTLSYQGFTVVGTRAENFDTVQILGQSSSKISFRFISSRTGGKDPLAAGDGPVINLLFQATGTGSGTVDTATLNTISTKLKPLYMDYVPAVVPITFQVGIRGDANGDGKINVGDAVYIITYIFRGGPAPGSYEGDANGDGKLNVGDAVYLISYIFRSGPPPPPRY